MKIIFFLLSITISVICAQEREPDSTPSSLANIQLKSKLKHQVTSNFKTYYFGTKSHTFTVDKRKNVTITRSCGAKLESSKCLAAVKLKEVNMNDLSETDLTGAKNPGAILCQKLLNADVLTGKDQDGNVASFCSFQDGTMVSAETLVAWANKNAKRSSNK
ncbi:MAG: hypothetical protein A2X86_00995 [Bdellovibrionales bacterium GWA2_49_15]|nr:MAG: hypothetical protein A2X86_00995 [Bdellovibrionales bacterium GWA2_49_15]HAZ11752.1 hypothetical protein [Bdellovibrionales bacterium]